MIGISAVNFDLDGAVICQDLPAADLDSLNRRIVRTATLDGGAVLDDGGFSHADRAITLVLEYSDSAWSIMSRLIKTHSAIGLATRGGYMRGALENLTRNQTGITASFLVTEG